MQASNEGVRGGVGVGLPVKTIEVKRERSGGDDKSGDEDEGSGELQLPDEAEHVEGF
jgi:hypothetical protein